MKIFHLSDLHLGKRVSSQSLIEDQKHVLDQIIEQVKTEKPEAVIIAGDIYDRTIPAEDAVELLDNFLYELSRLDTKVLMISGNHDSAERLAFGARIFNKAGIYISPEFNGKITSVPLSDEHGEVDFYLLPFVFPQTVQRFFPDKKIENCTEAVRALVSELALDTSKRNIMIAHQFVTASGAVETCDSESRKFVVGGAENVDVSVFEPFDYVALGHLHGCQSIGKDTVRYCGTPMKYSFSERAHKKSITVVELGEKGNINILEIPLVPLREWRQLEDKFDVLMQSEKCGDYIKVILTDDKEITNAFDDLRAVFPNLLQFDYKNRPDNSDIGTAADIEQLQSTSPAELFGQFFELQNGVKLNEWQRKTVSEIFDEISGGRQ